MKHHGSTPIHVGRSAITLRDVELYWTSTPDLKEVMTWMIKSKWIQWIKWNPKFLRDYKSHHLHLHWYLGTQQKDSEASDSHWACKDIRTNWPSKWSLDVADPVTKSDFKLRRHKSKVWSPKRNTTKPLGFVLCPSPQMCSKTSDLLKKHVRLEKMQGKLGENLPIGKREKKSAGGPMGALDLNVMGPAIQPSQVSPGCGFPDRFHSLNQGSMIMDQVVLHVHPLVWRRWDLWADLSPEIRLKILLYFCHSVLYLAIHACSSLSIAISNARIDSTSRSLLSLSSPVSLDTFILTPALLPNAPTLHLSLGRSQVFGAPDSRRRRSRCCHRCPENEALWRLALFLSTLIHSKGSKAQAARNPNLW